MVQSVYYCGKRVKILLLNCEESAFKVEAVAKLAPRVEEKNLFICQEDCKNGFVNSNSFCRRTLRSTERVYSFSLSC